MPSIYSLCQHTWTFQPVNSNVGRTRGTGGPSPTPKKVFENQYSDGLTNAHTSPPICLKLLRPLNSSRVPSARCYSSYWYPYSGYLLISSKLERVLILADIDTNFPIRKKLDSVSTGIHQFVFFTFVPSSREDEGESTGSLLHISTHGCNYRALVIVGSMGSFEPLDFLWIFRNFWI